MRPSCYECVYKHLGEAATWEMEYVLGYPKFKLYIVGSLSQASTEAYKFHPELAGVIREHRLRWTADPEYDIPYEDLGEFVDLCAQAHAADPEAPLPKVPAALLPPA